MTLPRFPEFKPLALEDREAVQGFFDRCPVEASEFSFGNNFIWRHYDRPLWTTLNGNLCLRLQPPDEPPYCLAPVGDQDIPATINACLTIAPRLSRVPASFARTYCPGFRCAPDRDNFDYVYAAEDLIELRGKKYDGKRNRIKKFERGGAWRYVPLTADHLEACHRLFEEWLAGKELGNAMIGAQKEAIREALTHYSALDLVGGAIEVEGRIAAFSLGERLTPDTAVIHIEIVSPLHDGLSQLMNREFVRNAWSGFAFINRESDLGVPGLRRAKQSYYPHHMVEKHHIWR